MQTAGTDRDVVALLGLALVFAMINLVTAERADGGEPPDNLAFTTAPLGEFHFNTGVLRGKLRSQGKSTGLGSVVHVPSGIRLDRSMGLFSHYRVFTTNKRYGTAAWDWPSTARLTDDGAVEVRWAADTNRPFELRAVYRWAAPDTLDLDTIVTAKQDLTKFESFLASYFASNFTNSLACVSDLPSKPGTPGFLAAEKSLGPWQMFPRDDAAVAIVNDGRWQIAPNPVTWGRMPVLAKPIGVRRDPVSGVSAALMARAEDCFAVMMPFETEGHYSLYLSLFGRDVKAGETARARCRLIVRASFSAAQTEEAYQAFTVSLAER
ncbi:MAG: hypothetical protein HZA90_24015 [Verrucomicrobia bacterium]|nr:hypothetical protein [Verrucomicrobiota bacterium]